MSLYLYIFANVCLKLKLTDCRFTCHYRCRALIRLDCCWDRGSLAEHTCVVEHTIETDTNVVRTFEFWQYDWLRTLQSFLRSSRIWQLTQASFHVTLCATWFDLMVILLDYLRE